LPVTCVSDDLGKLGTSPKLARPHECTLREGRSEYEAAFCTDNREDCARDRDSEACRDWQALCGSDEPEPGPGPGEDEHEPAATDGGGCALRPAANSELSPLFAAGALAALLGWRRRPR
jgi:hypothetical protein